MADTSIVDSQGILNINSSNTRIIIKDTIKSDKSDTKSDIVLAIKDISDYQEQPKMVDMNTQTPDAPILLNQYIFNRIVNNTMNSLKTKVIRCPICIDDFKPNDSSYYMCRKCYGVLHYDCGKPIKLTCPMCKSKSGTGIKWYDVIKKDHNIYNLIEICINIKSELNNITKYKDLPRNMIPTLEAKYEGITSKIKDVFDTLENNICSETVLKKSMELSNYVMGVCDDIDQKQKITEILNKKARLKLNKIMQKELELQKKEEELNRQQDLLSGCKYYLLSAVSKIDEHVVQETGQIFDTGSIKTKIQSWEDKEPLNFDNIDDSYNEMEEID